jgi:hypothetical protein
LLPGRNRSKLHENPFRSGHSGTSSPFPDWRRSRHRRGTRLERFFEWRSYKCSRRSRFRCCCDDRSKLEVITESFYAKNSDWSRPSVGVAHPQGKGQRGGWSYFNTKARGLFGDQARISHTASAASCRLRRPAGCSASRLSPLRSGCCGPPPLRSGPNFPWTVCSHTARREIRPAPCGHGSSLRLATKRYEKFGLVSEVTAAISRCRRFKVIRFYFTPSPPHQFPRFPMLGMCRIERSQLERDPRGGKSGADPAVGAGLVENVGGRG